MNESELNDLPDLPFTPSPVMAYHEASVARIGNTLHVGYLVDDIDCEDPLESCDGMGRIYSAHRHSSTHQEMQRALGLDRYWNLNHAPLMGEHLDQFRSTWIEQASSHSEFHVWCFMNEDWVRESLGTNKPMNPQLYRRAAALLFDSSQGILGDTQVSFYDLAFTEQLMDQVRADLVKAGLIGDPDRVVLDCYEHGGQQWSVSGEGMQCRFDTASGAGLWVPDTEARRAIDMRSRVYAWGSIVNNSAWLKGAKKHQFFAIREDHLGEEVERSEPFEQWYQAFVWLQLRTRRISKRLYQQDRSAFKALVMKGRHRAAVELAKDSLQEYNDWLAGQCFGVVTATYLNEGTEDEPSWELQDEESTWGFIGSDVAMEEASMMIDFMSGQAVASAA